MINERNFVKVSRKWKGHEIEHNVVFDQDEVRIEATLEQFLIALAKEIVKVNTPDTKLQRAKTYVNKSAGYSIDSRELEGKLMAAVAAVVADMKEQTKY